MTRALVDTNLLVHKPPQAVTVGAREIPLKTSWVAALQAAQAAEQDNSTYMRDYFFEPADLIGLTPEEEAELGDQLDLYIECGKHQPLRTGKKGCFHVWSWWQDTDAIFVDFLRFYDIDLLEDRTMHWWTFKALFDCLPNDSECRTRIYWRGPGHKGEDKQQHDEMRKIYRLKEM